MPAKITFLGTAGGRVVVINQIRASGGWVLEMDGQMIHIDPGPGALVRAKQYGVKLSRLSGVVISHSHPDHYTDAEMVIEAMTDGAKKKRGFVMGSETVFKGGDSYRPVISPYHFNAVEWQYIVGEGDKVNVGKMEIQAVPTRHGEPNCFGFVFRGSCSLGFTGDGEFFTEQPDYFNGCDYLLINTLRPRNKSWPGHMNTTGARKLIEKVKPKMAIIQHFGINMLGGVAESEAKWITRETGCRTIAARDGLEVELNGKSREKGQTALKRFIAGNPGENEA